MAKKKIKTDDVICEQLSDEEKTKRLLDEFDECIAEIEKDREEYGKKYKSLSEKEQSCL